MLLINKCLFTAIYILKVKGDHTGMKSSKTFHLTQNQNEKSFHGLSSHLLTTNPLITPIQAHCAVPSTPHACSHLSAFVLALLSAWNALPQISTWVSSSFSSGFCSRGSLYIYFFGCVCYKKIIPWGLCFVHCYILYLEEYLEMLLIITLNKNFIYSYKNSYISHMCYCTVFPSFTEVWLTNKNCIYVRGTTWWFDTQIHCEMIITVKLINPELLLDS